MRLLELAVDGGEAVLGPGDRVGGVLALTLRDLEAVEELPALGGDLRRAVGQRGELGLGRAAALGELRQPLPGAPGARAPRVELGGDRRETLAPRRRLAAQLLIRVLALGEFGPAFAERGARRFERAEVVGIGRQRFARLACERAVFLGLCAVVRETLGGFAQIGETRGVRGRRGDGAGMALAFGLERLLGAPECGAGLRFVGRRLAQRRARVFVIPCGARAARRGFLELAAQRHAPVLLAQPRSRRGFGLGRDGETVPAPQGALAAHQALALGELGQQTRAVGRRDDPDLREPPRQRRRRGDELAQRRRARRQGWGGAGVWQLAPVHGRAGVGGRREIVAERCAERRLQSVLDGDRVEQRRPVVLLALAERFGERRVLGAKRGVSGFRPLQRLARGGLGRLQVVSPAFIGIDRGALAGDVLARARYGGLDAFERGARIGALRDGRNLVLDLGGLAAQPLEPRAELVDSVVEGGAASLLAGEPLGQRLDLAFERVDRLGGLRPRGVGAALGLLLALLRRGERRVLLLEAGDRGVGVAGERPLALDVGVDLPEPGLERVARLGQAAFLGLERHLRDLEPVQLGAGRGLDLAQRRHHRRGISLLGGGGGGGALVLHHRALGLV